MLSRRTALGMLFVAPAIIRPGVLMPISSQLDIYRPIVWRELMPMLKEPFWTPEQVALRYGLILRKDAIGAKVYSSGGGELPQYRPIPPPLAEGRVVDQPISNESLTDPS